MGHQLRGQICPADRADASLGYASSISDREHVVVVEVEMARSHHLPVPRRQKRDQVV
jgi:hypothetical protein